MKLLRAAKHMVLIILTVLVLIVMLFIPDLFLSYMDKESLSVKTEKSSPVTLELKSNISLCRKAYIAENGVREISMETNSTRAEIETEAQSLCDKLLLGYIYMGETEVQSDYSYGEEYGYDYPDVLDIDIKNVLPLHCTVKDTGESCMVWYIVMNIEDVLCTMVLDDETKMLIDLSMTHINYPCEYMRDDIMDFLTWLIEYINNCYPVSDVHFVDEKYQSYMEPDTGFIRSVNMVYEITMLDNDGYYLFNIDADTQSIHFGMTPDVYS
ncbi:MAG: hypothetical protein J6B01_09980 [Ruminococcus sp.]|nr:hypothetical protein [Ruminococcus sp.]MBP3380808.1 hypothetical protein [Ruminococcus sp.]